MAKKSARTISCKAWKSAVEYPSKESKPGVKESKGNMFNPIFKANVQRKHPVRCALAETELFSDRKPKCVVQNKNNGHKNPNDSYNHHNEIELYQGISKRNT